MKKVGLLIIALVIALGGLGVGYAMWSDTIFIDGSVETAEVCLQWMLRDDSDYCVGTEGDRPTSTLVAGKDPKWPIGNDRYWDKNVACTEVDYYEDEDGINYKKIVVTINHAYPGYFGDYQFDWKNCGTIPIKIQSLYIIPNNFNIATDNGWADPEVPEWWDANANGEIYFDWVDDDIVGMQLEPGDDASSSFLFLIMQTAEQNESYTFTIIMEAVQWNEYDPDYVIPGGTPLD